MTAFLKQETGSFLEAKTALFNRPGFIGSDPVSIPHLFSKKQDIEISGFLAATIAWGQRPVILKNARKLLTWMDDDPYNFIMNFSERDLTPFRTFVHRTFSGTDCVFFLRALRNLYAQKNSPEEFFNPSGDPDTVIYNGILSWRKSFLSVRHLPRSEKHFSDPSAGSACKRLNMFLRWMVRSDQYGVDFGLWKKLSTSVLVCPLDVHSARVARKLGLLKRKKNDWKAAAELTASLRRYDAADPVRFDYALFGAGVFEKF